jgi:DNA (cytosine-5)-methyltransferase 1
MIHGSLFSGIGGFDLAAEWMGWSNLFNCEWEDFPRQVLKHHFPNAIQHGDIKELDATAYAGRVDILTGGFPCQPYSLAGKRKGKEDERHLWPEMLRVIRECTPRYVVGENVRGLIGWNGGLVFEEVCADLEAEGYSVQPFLLPACGVGAPHRRDRIWFVAHANDMRRCQGHRKVQGSDGEVRQQNVHPEPSDSSAWPASDTDDGIRPQDAVRSRRQELAMLSWSEFPTVAPVCGGDDGLPKELDGITFSKWRRESIKAYGNAIVPQVALQIFKAIEQYELSLRRRSSGPRC